ncbi:NUDIX domain-containing protein [Rhodobacter sp. SY28-1]|uniref:NUDIX domain-containing protein n=1 Tax=Rhodobacter sp. SY28-1 TaxID=2562317 RepID=UPI0010BFB76D|nr:NUDIX domain-containing protein [Rhodobacter sp. SY28-1]
MSVSEDWPEALWSVVLGEDAGLGDARAVFFARVMPPDAIRADAEGLALAGLVMQAFGRLSPEVVARRLPSLRVEAASRVRAAGAPVAGLRLGTGEVASGPPDPAHAGFFAVNRHQLRHRRFDGGMSDLLTREVFVVGDAVTVLPYDPVRDRVLLIEQFRMGPFGRGDPLPWQLEAIAGRIDPGESPEDAARREAVEEAGLVLGRLEKVAEYYPTPGAVAEFLYSYVALCDLPDGVAGVFGAAEEGEDIKGHLLSFGRLVEVMASGEIGNAPLLLTVLWLQRERARLRG